MANTGFEMPLLRERSTNLEPSGVDLLPVKEREERKKRRVRTATVGLACEACRSKHKKCDGVQPICGRCAKVDDACLYIAKRRKQKPITDISMTGHEAPTNDVGQPLMNEIHFSNSMLFISYTGIYERHIAGLAFHSFAKISSNYSDLLSATTPKQLMFSNSILACGALLCGNLQHANEFHMRARRILSTIYDDTSALVAATHGIFAHHYCLLGNLDKAANATTLAIRMLESLSRKQAALADDGFNHAGLYALVRLLVIDVIPSSNPTQLRTSLKQLCDTVESLTYETMRQRNLVSAFYKTVFLSNEAIVAPIEAPCEFLREVEYVRALQKTLNMNQAVEQTILGGIEGSLAIFYLRSGNAEGAIRAADAAIAAAARIQTEIYDSSIASSLFCAGQVFVRLGLESKYRQLLQWMSNLPDSYPMIRRAFTKLTSLHELVTIHGFLPEALALIPICAGWTWELADFAPITLLPNHSRVEGIDNGSVSLVLSYGEPSPFKHSGHQEYSALRVEPLLRRTVPEHSSGMFTEERPELTVPTLDGIEYVEDNFSYAHSSYPETGECVTEMNEAVEDFFAAQLPEEPWPKLM